MVLSLLPTITVSPSGHQANVKAFPRPVISLVTAFDRTSQNFTTPSELTLYQNILGQQVLIKIAAGDFYISQASSQAYFPQVPDNRIKITNTARV
jgi:hypothetical protein